MRFFALGSTMIEPDAVFSLLLAVVQNDSKPVRQKTWKKRKYKSQRNQRKRVMYRRGNTALEGNQSNDYPINEVCASRTGKRRGKNYVI